MKNIQFCNTLCDEWVHVLLNPSLVLPWSVLQVHICNTHSYLQLGQLDIFTSKLSLSELYQFGLSYQIGICC